jgi:hypothetical protein
MSHENYCSFSCSDWISFTRKSRPRPGGHFVLSACLLLLLWQGGTLFNDDTRSLSRLRAGAGTW